MEQELLNMEAAPGSPDAKENRLLEAPPVVKNLSGNKRRFMLPCGDTPIEGKREDSPEAGAGFGQPSELRLEDDEAMKKAGKPPIAPRYKRTARFAEPVVQPSRAASPLPMFERELSLWLDTPAAEDSEAMLAVGACVREPVKRELHMDAGSCNFDSVCNCNFDMDAGSCNFELPELMRLDEI